MLPHGAYINRIRFERRIKISGDGYGNNRAAWEGQAEVWAAFRPQFGKEQMAAGQLASTMIGVLTVRRSADTIEIKSSDRVIFTIGPYAGQVCQIRSIVPRPDNAEIEMTIEAGAQT